jgi:5,10-methylenetetrahydromethanopterin reductase
MRLGVVVPTPCATIDGVAAQLERLEALGVDSAWMPGIPNGPDILTLLAVAGRATDRIELGTAIVPVFPRHPAALAVQALAVHEALGGRFTLGVGLSHQKVVERQFGLSYERPVAFMRDYLEILRPLLDDGSVDHAGDRLRTRLRLDVARPAPAARPPGVLVAALGPRMLQLAGQLADGTMTWMTGPATIESHVVPRVRAAAEAAGRPAPRVAVSMPVMLTVDEEEGRVRADEAFAIYGRLPAYRAMLDREGASSPGQIALVGDEASLTKALVRLQGAGVTDFQVTPFGDQATIDRTVEYLASRPAG